MLDIFGEMERAVIEGDKEKCIELARVAIEMNVYPAEALEKGYAKGMEALGDKFESGEVYLPELLFAEEAMYAAIDVLRPRIEEAKTRASGMGKIVIGSIQGDVHDIGKNIVKLFLTVAGFEVIDLGRDVPVRTFIEAAKKEGADIIAASALMTTTMVYMPEVIKQLKEMGIRDKHKVMIGGAPVIRTWAEEIGADGYGLTSKEAVEVAMSLTS